MTALPLAWTLLTVTLWTTGLSQTPRQEPGNILYPKISSPETIECNCLNVSCDSVFWFRSTSSNSHVLFLAKYNNADRVDYGPGVEETRFKFSKRSHTSFVLRIVSVQKEDKGIYSCVLREKSKTELWKPGTLLLPGVTPPTSPPKTKSKPVQSVCRCPKKKNPPRGDCNNLVLWPLVGVLTALAVALISTLYYYSRLPKKCRHHFMKMRPTAPTLQGI